MKTPLDKIVEAEFDAFAGDYDAALEKGISVSGEGKEFFAKGRVAWLAKCLKIEGYSPKRILDFGCGTGSAVPFLLGLCPDAELVGVDVSSKSIEIARNLHGSSRVSFLLMKDFVEQGSFDLAFCNGVFHHIPPHERGHTVEWIFSALRPGGYFSFWENNPWNPGTRIVMSRIPFDRDAQTISAPDARKLLIAGGVEIIKSDSIFYFPRCMSYLRPLEHLLAWIPLGAQYQILARTSV